MVRCEWVCCSRLVSFALELMKLNICFMALLPSDVCKDLMNWGKLFIQYGGAVENSIIITDTHIQIHTGWFTMSLLYPHQTWTSVLNLNQSNSLRVFEQNAVVCLHLRHYSVIVANLILVLVYSCWWNHQICASIPERNVVLRCLSAKSHFTPK